MNLSPANPLDIHRQITAADVTRFMSLVSIDPATGCWVWLGAQCDGYGRFRWNGRTYRAHRWARAVFGGPIPAGYDVDHVDECRNPLCVAPFHTRSMERIAHRRRHGGESNGGRGAVVEPVPF